MKILRSVLIYLTAILIVAPCILIICEGNTILPNVIGLSYAYLIYKLSFTKYGKKFIKEIIRINHYINQKL